MSYIPVTEAQLNRVSHIRNESRLIYAGLNAVFPLLGPGLNGFGAGRASAALYSCSMSVRRSSMSTLEV